MSTTTVINSPPPVPPPTAPILTAPTTPNPSASVDYALFARTDFDANDYANAVLAGDPYPPPSKSNANKKKEASTTTAGDAAKEDISVALAKLTAGIEDVSTQLRFVVTTHHEALLSEASSVHQLEGSVDAVRQGLLDLNNSLDKLRTKIRVPYQTLSAHVVRLQRLQLASDVLRRTSRFVLVARRLEFQMKELAKAPVEPKPHAAGEGTEVEGERERTVAKAALSVAELTSLCSPDSLQEAVVVGAGVPAIPLTSINAVTRYIPSIDEARVKITEEMESMLRDGLRDLNRSLLSSSLQTAHNLRVLPQLVGDVVDELCLSVEETPVATAASTLMATYRSRIRTEPTNVTAPQWSNALWTRLEGLIEDLATSCIKIYTLEKVLKLKRDGSSKVTFLDEALKVLDSKPSSTFWMTVARSLEAHSKEGAKNSSFLQQTLSNSYPRLLRLFHDFFTKISLHTETLYTQSYQSPETVLVLRSTANFEATYLARSSNRITEVVGQAVRTGSYPGATEGVGVARVMVNELDSSRFDPLLVRSVARSVVAGVELFMGRLDVMTVRDRSATALVVGPSTTIQQAQNAQLVSAMYHCWLRLSKLEGEYHESVWAILAPAVQSIETAYEKITEPLLSAIRRDLSAIAARLHRVDYSSNVPGGGMGGGPSPYMKDMAEKMAFVRNEVLGRFSVGELWKTWMVSIVRRTTRAFVLHASLAKPLGESGKLQLTTDMTEFEFALNAFMTPPGKQQQKGSMKEVLAEDYMALRALRQLLFLEDNASLVLEEKTGGLPPLIVLHHILVRSPLPLPHTTMGWKVDEYVRWVDEHTEQEAYALVENCLSRYEEQSEGDEGEEFIGLVRQVLVRVM